MSNQKKSNNNSSNNSNTNDYSDLFIFYIIIAFIWGIWGIIKYGFIKGVLIGIGWPIFFFLKLWNKE